MPTRDVSPSPTRTAIHRFAFVGVLGVVSTVAVAWFFTRDFDRLTTPARVGERMTFDRTTGGAMSGIRVFRYDSVGRTEIMGQGPAWSNVMLGPGQRMETLEEILPSWDHGKIASAVGGGHVLGPQSGTSHVLMAVGWPMRSLWCPYRQDPNPTGYWMLRAERAIVLKRATAATPLGRFGPRDDALPVLPLWTGFVVDTALFAGVWAWSCVHRARSDGRSAGGADSARDAAMTSVACLPAPPALNAADSRCNRGLPQD